MNSEMYQQEGQQATIQWIVSLAISVICCAVLFVVFAGYLMDLQRTVGLSTIRIEILQDRQSQLAVDLEALRRLPVIQMQTAPRAMQQQPAPTAEAPVAPQTPAPAPAPQPAATEQPAAAPPPAAPATPPNAPQPVQK